METNYVVSQTSTVWPVSIATFYGEEREKVLKQKDSFTEVKSVKILGIDCSEKTEKEPQMVTALLKEAEAEHSLKMKLRKENIPYLAVLPTQMFTELLKPLPFYTFRNISDAGEVFANVKGAVADKYDKALIPIILLWVSAWIVIIGWGNALFGLEFEGKFVSCIISLIITGILSETIKTIIANKEGNYFEKNVLWPEKNDEKEGLKYEYVEQITGGGSRTQIAEPELVQLLLPAAPKSVQNTLIRCKKLEIQTFLVVHENAFQIVLQKEQLKKALTFVTKNDPIICSDYNMQGIAFTVIHEQYGDFPEEKDLVDAIRKKFSIIVQEHIHAN